MSSAPLLAFYDSGIGGLPYARMCRSLMPDARFVYYADSAHFPLGTRPVDEVRRIVVEAAAAIVARHHPDVLVLACNTASVVALSAVRDAFPDLAVVGTVPAIKPAAERGRGGIAVLGSERTVSDPYTHGLVERFAQGKRVRLVAAPGWIEFVERNWLGSTAEQRREAVRPLLEGLMAEGVETFVMACTHFLYLEDDIRSVAGDSSLVIDSAEGVARRARDMAARSLEKRPEGSRPTESPSDLFHASAFSERLLAFAREFGFADGGTLP